MSDPALDDAFIQSVRREMIGFARLQLRDAAMAEDAVQEALLAAFAQMDRFSARSTLKTWVFGILRHKIIDLIREQGKLIQLPDLMQECETMDAQLDRMFRENAHWSPQSRPQSWGNPEASLEDKYFWRVFDACLTVLPENTARIFVMRELLEFETAEICSLVDITPSHCHVVLHRARSALRRCLEKGWFKVGDDDA